ncbi:hypothetical protein K456DRAFT_1181005 [Colletotrichum gloeosporioides 23]|nr:hypothetical protein K456DRAFT_1181005 [Colletotrichum gloeosporioides 23]
MRNSSLFPCPFYHHDPAKYTTQQWRSCMGPGWTIPRLKEHIYRRHCLPEHACQRCLAVFNSQSELVDHERYPRCPVLSDSASGKIGKSKKDRIRPRRAKMLDYDKWVVIYRILFDSDPVRASPSYTQSSESSQPTESPETLTSFEHYLRTRKRLDGSESASEQVQICLNLIREWREEQNAIRPRQASRDPSIVPNGGFTLIDASQVSQNEVASWPGVGNEERSLDWSLMDELYNTDVSDQWLLDSFSYEPPGDVSWDYVYQCFRDIS